tara:strand:- start:1920 stop:2156 length:237 start_codon:yes stop_codon:yes gene_type:complete
MLYIRNGMPEFMAPKNKILPSLPLNARLLRMMKMIKAKPIRPKKTLKNAVLIGPITGEAILIKRKLAPQIAASDSSRI